MAPAFLSVLLFFACLMGNNASRGGGGAAGGEALNRVKALIAEHPTLMFSKTTCPFCSRAKALIGSLSPDPEMHVVELNQEQDGSQMQAALHDLTQQRTVPNTFIGGKHIGGCDDVTALHSRGELAPMLAGAAAAHKAAFPAGATPPAVPPAASCDADDVAAVRAGFSDGCAASAGPRTPGEKLPIAGDESIMAPKAHGTSPHAVQENLRYGCDRKVADQICSFNRHYAEHSGYFQGTSWLSTVPSDGTPTTYYDSVTGKPLFIAPKGRTFEEFVKESRSHGWPSFRDEEVVWENVRVLDDGECVSVDGTHLGHNLPSGGLVAATGLSRKRNRYCINLVSVAGNPPAAAAADGGAN